MGAFTTGAVVLVRFPFSDLSHSKLRPAVVLADSGRGDWLLCQITSNSYGDPLAVQLAAADFRVGGLRIASYSRPLKIFTAHETLISTRLGVLRAEAFTRIVGVIVKCLTSPIS